MSLLELILIAVGLSMDAFAVSVCKGLSMKKSSVKACLICGIWFGGFQFLMPMIGYFLGARFESLVNATAPWIAFVLLALIGANMIKEAFEKEEEVDPGLDIKTMFLMAVATSIDALAVGITFAMVPLKIMKASGLINTFTGCVIIGITTFVISFIGVRIGNIFGSRYKSPAEVSGGTILIFIGLKVLLEHLGALDYVSDTDVLFGLLIPFAGTVIGAAFVYIIKDRFKNRTGRLLTGFAAGIMLAAAVFNLLLSSYQLSNNTWIILLGFWLGTLFQLLLDHYIPHMHNFTGEQDGPESDLKINIKLLLASVMHHLPEGIAVGAMFSAFLLGNTGIGKLEALVLAAGMGIQNFPEAALLSLPIKDSGENKNKSFLMGVVSGAVEPLSGIITVIIVGLFNKALPLIMAFSAGAIIFVVVEELIPESSKDKHSNKGVISFAVGFSLMMALYLLAKS